MNSIEQGTTHKPSFIRLGLNFTLIATNRAIDFLQRCAISRAYIENDSPPKGRLTIGIALIGIVSGFLVERKLIRGIISEKTALPLVISGVTLYLISLFTKKAISYNTQSRIENGHQTDFHDDLYMGVHAFRNTLISFTAGVALSLLGKNIHIS